MILGSIKSDEEQIIKQNNKYLIAAVERIKKTDFSKIADGKYTVSDESFYYILTSYSTKDPASKIFAETHKNFIDFHYIITGEEKIGYADLSNPKVIVKNYDPEKDTELYSTVLNESFLIIKKGMFALFYPEDIHRPGLAFNEIISIRKIIFKVKIEH